MKLCEMGMRVSPTPDGIWALAPKPVARGRRRDASAPGFATDFMPIAVALMTVAEGSAIVTENVYDGRFQFVDELARMGADVRTEGRHAIVRGVERLSGAPVRASDVRAGAALVLAGLVADGETVVLRLRARRPGLPRPPGHASAPSAPTSSGSDDVEPAVGPRSGRAGHASARCSAAGREQLRYWGCSPQYARTGALHAARSRQHGRRQSSRRSTRSAPRSRATAATSSSTSIDEDGVVHVTLVGACGTCPVSMMTLKAGVERIIMDRVPGVTEVVADE